MEKMTFVKRSAALIIIMAMCILLAVKSEIAMSFAVKGFDTWLHSVLPALFPFFVCISVLEGIGAFGTTYSHNALTLPMAYLVSAVSGAPSGTRITEVLIKSGAIASKRRTLFSAVLNNASPMFIIGSVACSMLGNISFAYPIIIGHYITSALGFIVAVIVSKKDNTSCIHSNDTDRNYKIDNGILYRLADAINNGMHTMLCICGAIIFFMVTLNLFDSAGIFDVILLPIKGVFEDLALPKSVLFGMVEMVSGSKEISALMSVTSAVKCSLISFVLSFGGVCILAQSICISRLRISEFLLYKLAIAAVSATITYFAAQLILPSELAVFGSSDATLSLVAGNSLIFISLALSCVISILFMYSLCSFCEKKKLKRTAEK